MVRRKNNSREHLVLIFIFGIGMPVFFGLWKILIFGVVIAGIAAIIEKKSCESNINECQRIIDEKRMPIEDCEGQIQDIIGQISDDIQIIPVDYRYSMAVEYIYSCLLNQRAATIGEAINLYEDQIHKWKMEQMQEQILESTRQQQVTMRNIERNSSVAAAASVAGAMLNV